MKYILVIVLSFLPLSVLAMGKVPERPQAKVVVPQQQVKKPNSNQVCVNGIYAGQDPDPFIRSQLQRDPPWDDNDRESEYRPNC